MKKKITKKLIIWLSVVGVLSCGLFVVLIGYNRGVSSQSTAEMGDMYMAEMTYQVKDHLETIVSIKTKESIHIAEHTRYSTDLPFREILKMGAMSMDYEYLALYDLEGNYETILGEDAWYRDLENFITRVMDGEELATTGYLTGNGGRYLVFCVPASYEMDNGKISDVLLLGFSVNKLYQYINLDELKQMGSNATVEIISTNGSYILKDDAVEETSFYDRVQNFGGFVGMDWKQGVSNIEKAMARGDSFSKVVSVNGELQHIYGDKAQAPEDWYLVISMPQGVIDSVVTSQNRAITHAYIVAGMLMLTLILIVFSLYIRLSLRQIKEIEDARAEAEMASQAKSIFLSNMSHDIRTPMNAIVGFAEIMQKKLEKKDYEGVQNYLDKMKYSSGYLRNLINDVLDMSKIESGMLSLTPEAMSLRKMVDMVAVLTHSYIAASNKTFDIQVHDILHDGICCDNTRLKQILINILSNAVKFTAEDGNIRFEIWQERSVLGDGYVKNCFLVEDDGIGMSPEFKEKMFESFSREESKVRKIEGTGLGLTITKSLLNMMDGTIEVKSEEGIGSTFFVTIDTPKAEYVFEREVADSMDDELNGYRILLAEDNEFNYDIASVLLNNYGVITSHARDGQEAYELYTNAPYAWDMILMDLRMPILNGYQAAKKIREFEISQPDALHIPIIALSADVFAEDIENCMEAGMEAHIAKPIDIHELKQTIRIHARVRE